VACERKPGYEVVDGPTKDCLREYFQFPIVRERFVIRCRPRNASMGRPGRGPSWFDDRTDEEVAG
jgi:hypothetical protein